MKTYWPCAIRKTSDGTEYTISTYDSCFSLEEAQKMFNLWRDYYKYNIVKFWVDVYEDGVKRGKIYDEN